MTSASAPNGRSTDGSVEEAASVLVRVGTFDEVRSNGVLTASGNGKVAAVFHNEGRVYTVDDRRPHMGFPLSRGSCKDGILTCEWHYARFDLATGGALDLWAGVGHGLPRVGLHRLRTDRQPRLRHRRQRHRATVSIPTRLRPDATVHSRLHILARSSRDLS